MAITDLIQDYKVEMSVSCSYTSVVTLFSGFLVFKNFKAFHSNWLSFLTVCIWLSWVFYTIASILYYWQLNDIFGSGKSPTPD